MTGGVSGWEQSVTLSSDDQCFNLEGRGGGCVWNAGGKVGGSKNPN